MEKESPGRSYGIRGAASLYEQAQRLQGMRRFRGIMTGAASASTAEFAKAPWPF